MMKSFKKVLSIVMLVLLLGCMALTLISCKKDNFVGEFFYRIKSDSTAAVYVESYNMEELIVPETIAGIKVTGILKPKKDGINTTLKKVVLPKTVRWIEKEAFMDCTVLEEINFPANMDKIYEDAFKNCSSLKKVILPNKVSQIYEGAFDKCMSLKVAYIPQSVSSIGYWAFGGSPDLEIWIQKDKAPWTWSGWNGDVTNIHWNWDGVVPEEVLDSAE